MVTVGMMQYMHLWRLPTYDGALSNSQTLVHHVAALVASTLGPKLWMCPANNFFVVQKTRTVLLFK